LKRLRPSSADALVKIIESLSFLGDSEGVVAMVPLLTVHKLDLPPHIRGMCMHLEAVALRCLGRTDEAAELWEESLGVAHDRLLVEGNLRDLELPVSERNGPWAFDMRKWIAPAVIKEYVRKLKNARSSDEATRLSHQFLRDRPEMIVAAVHILERGDPFGREFAVRLADTTRNPELLRAVKAFALSDSGSDQLRMQAVELAKEERLIERGLARMWIRGEWSDIQLRSYKISPEATDTLDPKLREVLLPAHQILSRGDGKGAEPLFRKAVELDPSSASSQFNLSMAVRLQGRVAEADTLLRLIHARFPDYFFGIVGMAKVAIDNLRLDEARELLNRVGDLPEYHASEFSMMALTEFSYWLAKNDYEAAKSWIDLLEQTNPDDLNLPVVRKQLRARRERLAFGE
jgi:tetratricopeptide (TPR) repeat protein